MALTAEERQKVSNGLQRHWSQIWEQVGASSDELLVTVNETDAWIEDNQASYNSALTYAGDFTAAQKTLIFCAVALARVGLPFLRRVFGGVD